MANDLLNQNSEPKAAAASSDGVELDINFGFPVEDKPIWTELWESIRDVFFPPKLPPLVLTSTPIPVPDRMAVKPNPWAIGISTAVNLAIVAVLLVVGVKKIIDTTKQQVVVTPVELTQYKGPKSPSLAGGGGGRHDDMEANKGRIPPRATQTFDAPKLASPEPTIDVQKDIEIPDNPSLPNFGMSNSTNVKLASGGNGSGFGLGNGNGNGYGNGSGGNIGGGVYHVGGGISAPVPIYDPDPEFSDEARRAKYQGIVLVGLIVDAQGNPQNVHIVRSLGMGLDENAMKAVRTYKFKPAMNGKTPVPVQITIEVNFRLY